MLHTQRSKVATLKTRKQGEVREGIAAFEQNIIENFEEGEKIAAIVADEAADNDGLDGGDDLMRNTTLVGNANELMESLSNRIPHPTILNLEANEFLDKIKESKIAGNLARSEREKRRRRFLVDLQAEDEFDQTCFLLDQLTAELTKPCVEEERMNYTVYKAAQYEHVIRCAFIFGLVFLEFE